MIPSSIGPAVETASLDDQAVSATQVNVAAAATPSPATAAPGNPCPPDDPNKSKVWTPEDRAKTDAYIRNALEHNGGDVNKALNELRNLRQLPQNHYDKNLANAADYLRSRDDSRIETPPVSAAKVEIYSLMKRMGLVPQEGCGPVSPYSDAQAQYMRRGVIDGARDMSALEWAALAAAPLPRMALGVGHALTGEA